MMASGIRQMKYLFYYQVIGDVNILTYTVWKVSEYGVYGVNLHIRPNTGKYGPKKTSYLDAFLAMIVILSLEHENSDQGFLLKYVSVN